MRRAMSYISNKWWLILVFALAIALPFLVGAYRLQIFIFVITYSLLALGFQLTMRVGLPRFDVAAWWGVGAYTTAMLMLKADMSFWLTLPISVLISVVLGYIVFSVSVRRGMMVFLMFGMVFALALQQIFGTVEFFGGWGGTPQLPPVTIGSYVLNSKMWIYYFGLALLIFNLGVYQLLYKSRIGRAWSAIGSGHRLASSLGVDVVGYRLANVLIGNAFIALAGSFSVMYQAMVLPNTYGFQQSINVMMYVVVGGLAFALAGPVVGALVLTVISESMRAVEQYQPIVTGIITVLILIFAPGGLLGLLRDHFLRPIRQLLGSRATSPVSPSSRKPDGIAPEEKPGKDA